MRRQNIPKDKINKLRRMFIAGKFVKTKAAIDLKIARVTVKNYVCEFELIKEYFPEQLNNMDFFMPVADSRPRVKELDTWLEKNLMDLILAEVGPRLLVKSVWKKYKALQPEGYFFTQFRKYFFTYCKDHDITLNCTKRIESIPEDDRAILKYWRGSNDHFRWRISVMLDAANTRKSLLKTCDKIECCFRTALFWIETYKTKGLAGFEWTYTPNPAITQRAKEKAANLIHLLQQSPKNYGQDRVSWTTISLAETFTKIHGVPASQPWVSHVLRKNNIRYRKASEVLTSPDPLFKEKFAAIQTILENLGEKEKFFSIDEYGPFAVKAKGGSVLSMSGVKPVYPQMKESKGWFVMTAALELSTNQVSHFYCKKKDTEEMLKLIELLLLQYADQDKLYLSWDAASWHASKKLLAYIEEHNTNKAPLIGVAPLPASAQFLNVIESVFSGMSKSVIRNSNYETEEACKAALDNYFQKRNAYFLENPKKAGNKIWGKERVKPVFDKGNICKSPYHY